MRRVRPALMLVPTSALLLQPAAIRAQESAETTAERATGSAGSSALQLISVPPITYPEGASGSAVVVVSISIGTDGVVTDARLLRRTPEDASELFAEAALAIARNAIFEPIKVGNRAIAAQSELTLRFAPPAPAADAVPETTPELETVPPAAVASASTPAPAPPSALSPPASAHVRARRPDATVGEVHLHGALLKETGHRTASEMLASAPGILLTNHGGEGHAPAVFLRGFDAGEGQDLEFRLDGVPLNEPSNPHSHGYADTHFVIPELVDELRVVEGPFDPRQGDFSVAGTAEYHLGLHERGLRLLGGYGNFGTTRALALWGPEGTSDGTFVGVDFRSSDGFGANRTSASASAMAQYEGRLGDDTRLTLLGQGYAARFGSAGVLRQDDYLAGRLPCAPDADSQFFCTYDTNQGGSSSRHGLSLRLERRLPGVRVEQQLFASMRQLRLRENFTGFLYDLVPVGETQRGDSTEKRYDAATFGLRGALRLRRLFWSQPQELELGYQTRFDQLEGVSRRLRAVGGEAYRRDLDYAAGVSDLALYGAASLRVTSRLSLRGGARLEAFGYQLEDRNRPEADRSGVRLPSDLREAFGWTVLPRLTVQYQLMPGLEWMTSAGTGARSSDAAALSNGEFAPFHTVGSVESGVAHELRGEENRWQLATRLSTFATRVDQALVFDEVLARNSFAGPSSRYGALLLAKLGLGGWLEAQASTTYAEAYRPPAEAPTWMLWAGERMPYVPRWVSRLDANAKGSSTANGEEISWSVGTGVTHIGPRPLPLGAFSEQIFTIDATATARWRWLELGVVAQNLLDARYRQAEYNYASNFASAELAPSLRAARTFAAGAPRQLLATLSVRFDALAPDESDHDHHQEDPP